MVKVSGLPVLLIQPFSKVGVISIVATNAIAVLFILPWLDKSPVRSSRFRPLYKLFFWLLLLDCIVLGYLGAKPAEGIYVILSRLATAYYFFHFLIVLPLLPKIEKRCFWQ